MHLSAKTCRAQHAQRIGGERPPSRSQLNIDGVGRRACLSPAIGQRRADQLAKHLADFGRGGEIAPRAQGVARRVIISVAGFHIGFDADRPFGANSLVERALERRHATLAVPAAGSTRTRRRLAVSIRYSPPTIIGSDSHWPM